MPRYVFGPTLAEPFAVTGDVQVTLDGAPLRDEATGVVSVPMTVPPFDPTHSSKLTKVFFVFGPAAPTEGDTPQSYLEGPGRFVGGLPYEGDGSAAVPLAIPVAGVTPGSWFGQSVLEFDA